MLAVEFDETQIAKYHQYYHNEIQCRVYISEEDELEWFQMFLNRTYEWLRKTQLDGHLTWMARQRGKTTIGIETAEQYKEYEELDAKFSKKVCLKCQFIQQLF